MTSRPVVGMKARRSPLNQIEHGGGGAMDVVGEGAFSPDFTSRMRCVEDAQGRRGSRPTGPSTLPGVRVCFKQSVSGIAHGRVGAELSSFETEGWRSLQLAELGQVDLERARPLKGLDMGGAATRGHRDATSMAGRRRH